MSTLKGLTPAARAALSEDFRRGTVPTVDVAEHVVNDLGFGRAVSLEPLRWVIEHAMKNKTVAESDSWLGPRVHAALRLTRREAADKWLWEYLTVVEFPDYVRWRWPQKDEQTGAPINRFIGNDITNSLARLWWIAELTRNGCDYASAVNALEVSQYFVWQGLVYTHHRPAALASIGFLRDFGGLGASNPQIARMATAVNANLRTVCLDILVPNPPTDAEAVREWVADKVDATLLTGDELPVGPDETPVSDEHIATVRKFLDELAERSDLAGTKRAKAAGA